MEACGNLGCSVVHLRRLQVVTNEKMGSLKFDMRRHGILRSGNKICKFNVGDMKNVQGMEMFAERVRDMQRS